MVAMREMFHHYDIKAKTLRIKTEVASKWHISAVALSCNITFSTFKNFLQTCSGFDQTDLNSKLSHIY